MSGRDYKHMLVTAAGTSGSRILGMVRDLLIAAFFGTSGVAAAFLLAFQLPNLFRRLLGEGALTTALVPPITEELKAGGKPAAFAFFNLVVRRILPWMLGIVVLIAALALGVSFLSDAGLTALADFLGAADDAERNRLSLQMIAFTIPYMPLICLAAIFSAGLNVLGKFNATSLTAVWLNLTMIAALVLSGYVFGCSQEACAWWLCVGILAGGVLQLGVPAAAIATEGWRPSATAGSATGERSWDLLKSMFFPALIGAGITQFNIFFTRLIAFGVDDQALSVYHYANRLVEIPTGIFSASIFTVVYPLFAAFAARRDFEGLRSEFFHGVRLIFAIIVPAIVGIVLLAQPLVEIFFQHGRFNAADTAATVPVVCIFTLAVLFYSLSGMELKCLNAMGDTRPQRNSAAVAFVANCVFVVAFTMCLGWGVCGLALANLLSSVAQTLYLTFCLWRRERAFLSAKLILPFVKSCLAGTLMGVWVYFGWRFFYGTWLCDPAVSDHWFEILCGLAVVVPAACVIYALAMIALRYEEVAELYNLVKIKIFRLK
ncbi:MAG: murein biosynthesis integral membrane protein MurJ [Opitutales bacterium]|nr:murein biosynthesis integral membrane protein MurJ [Opitutales bacterium]